MLPLNAGFSRKEVMLSINAHFYNLVDNVFYNREWFLLGIQPAAEHFEMSLQNIYNRFLMSYAYLLKFLFTFGRSLVCSSITSSFKMSANILLNLSLSLLESSLAYDPPAPTWQPSSHRLHIGLSPIRNARRRPI